MKIVVIGDIHGRDVWKKIIAKEKKANKIVFLGDYVSTHENISEEKQISNLKEILEYKELHPNKVVLLRGNHDMQHLGYYWAECSGLFRNVAKEMIDMQDRFLNNTQWIYLYKDIIFSHAGVSKVWLKNIRANQSIKSINKLHPSAIFGFTPTSSLDIYGDSATQPCTWIRPKALINNAVDGYKQVVGHTPVTKICDISGTNNIWVCDTLPFQYLVIEDDKFTPTYVDKPVIILFNRYNMPLYLEKINDNQWLLKGSERALKYIGVSYDSTGILAIDPEGGPYLAIGDKINHYTIDSIVESGLGFKFNLINEEENS